MKQYETFLNGEGDRYHERNHYKEPNPRLLDALYHLPFKPRSILEIGCGNARYLSRLHQHFDCACFGIDPSKAAIEEARQRHPYLELSVGCAHDLDLLYDNTEDFDLILFGFCLYLVDREHLFSIVAQTDKYLNNGGFLAIHDFDVIAPTKVPYAHANGVYSYKMHYPNLWLGNPAYKHFHRYLIDSDSSLNIIKKDLTGYGQSSPAF